MTPPFPAEALAAFARHLAADGQPDAYQRFRDRCDAVILAAQPTTPQVKFAKTLGLSRTTLRSMLRRLNLTGQDGRKAAAS